MSTPPKTPSSLLRSLGADDSYLDAKLKTSAREAEQRWPLFRALATAKADTTPTLSEGEKRAWEQHSPPAQAPRKPTLTRPGLSGKLAASLEKLANTSTPASRSKGPLGDALNQRELPAAQPVSNAVRAKARDVEANDFTASPPQLRGRKSLFSNAPDTAATTNQVSTHGLFSSTQATTRSDATGRPTAGRSASAPTKSLFAGPKDVPSGNSSDESLSALFSRVEGKQSAKSEPSVGNRPNSLMRRIARR
jgi:hypothetical protein